MKIYSHLSREEKYEISALHKSGHNNTFIAKYVDRSPSTISREISRDIDFIVIALNRHIHLLKPENLLKTLTD